MIKYDYIFTITGTTGKKTLHKCIINIIIVVAIIIIIIIIIRFLYFFKGSFPKRFFDMFWWGETVKWTILLFFLFDTALLG